jgi:CRP-like cAMP-binding protein
MSAEGEVREKQTAAVGRGSVPLEHRLALNEVPLFQALSKRHLRRVARLAEVRTYYGSTVCRAGTRGDALYIVLNGTAEVETPQGDVTRLEAGDVFGELALVDEAPRAATVTAAGQLTVARIPRTGFAKVLQEEPAIAVGLIGGLARIIRDVQAHAKAPAGDAAAGRVLDTAGVPGESGLGERAALGWLSTLSDVPLFRALSRRHLGRILRLAELRRYAAGATVVRLGAQGDAFHIVLDGRAEARPPVGRKRKLVAGDFFGELALLDGAPRAATVVALDDVTTARLPRAAFLKLVREEPTVARGVLRGLARIVRDLAPAPV